MQLTERKIIRENDRSIRTDNDCRRPLFPGPDRCVIVSVGERALPLRRHKTRATHWLQRIARRPVQKLRRPLTR
jgi:hypothetical protein